MKSNSLIVLLVIGTLCVNGRVLKRQRKRVLPKTSPARTCQRTVLKLPSPESLLEPIVCLGTGCPDPYVCPSSCGCTGTCGCPDIYSPVTCGCPDPYGCSTTCGCPDPYVCPSSCGCTGTCGCADIYSPVACGCPDSYGCPSSCGCPDIYDCPRTRGCQNIFLEELSCGCNYDSFADGYGILNADTLCYERVPMRLPKPLGSIDAGIPVAATLCRDDTSCQCQNSLPYKILDSPCSCRTYEFLNPVNTPSPVMKRPLEVIQPVFVEAPISVVQPLSCGCQMPVKACGCKRQKCGCQLSALDIPCSCQLPGLGTPCCTLAALDIPCSCQLSALNLPCGFQLPGLDCGCQFQAYNSPCSCQLPISAPCGCQLPVPNVPYAYQLASSDVTCGCQLSALDLPCSCQLPNCGCQAMLPPDVGCTKYLRQVSLQSPFVI